MHVETAAPFKFWSENPIWKDPNEPLVSKNIDSVVIVSSDISQQDYPGLNDFIEVIKRQKEVDDAFGNVVSFMSVNIAKYKEVKRLVYSPTGPLNRDYDDVRRFYDAAVQGIKRILDAGGKKPLLAVLDSDSKFEFTDLVAALGAAEAVYVPLEIRECRSNPEKLSKVQSLSFTSHNIKPEFLKIASAIESGRVLCRDIGGSDPEVMTAPNVATYVEKMFADTCIKVEIISDKKELEKSHPLLTAVDRATRSIDRHGARVIQLTYEPSGPYNTTLGLVGKGVTYDTGGADIKYGGHMVSMHRDKCGAAGVAGLFQTLSILKPPGIKVIGTMAMVRNSVGSDAYVSDEIITSAAGVRVRIGNTDAEGRMAMGDCLYHMKEKVLNEPNPYLFTVATLTGHACLAYGDGYTALVENGPAKTEKVSAKLQKAGEEVGEMFEISTLRREDYEFVKGKSEYEDLIQSNNLPSSQTARGHQSPAAFLIRVSGLDKHGIDSSKPLKYCHVDIAPSSGPFPGIPSGVPIAAFTKCFLIN